jgi:putative glycerol-1-phosphate prenyltransferase
VKSITQYLTDLRRNGEKALAILVDPDELHRTDYRAQLLRGFQNGSTDVVLVGGSLITGNETQENIKWLSENCELPLVLFPGSPDQLSPHVDAVLFLSLISGRNPELLIGQHVAAAPRIAEMNLEAISTGYMLIDGGKPTTASYISNTQPIPRDKPNIASATALAGQMLGMKCLYLDTGSGALFPVPLELIRKVRETVDIPIICGGGIRSVEEVEAAYRSGADLVVVGTLFEEQPELIAEFRSGSPSKK